MRAGISSRWASLLYELLAGAPPFREPVEGEKDTLLQRIQRARYTRVRTAAPLAPRWLAKLVHSLLRAKPRARPASAQQVRRLLERQLAAFPTDAKLELASFLWSEGVFQPREGDTVVLSTLAPVRAPRLRHLALAAGLAGALALAAHQHRELEQLPALVRQAQLRSLARPPSRPRGFGSAQLRQMHRAAASRP